MRKKLELKESVKSVLMLSLFFIVMMSGITAMTYRVEQINNQFLMEGE